MKHLKLFLEYTSYKDEYINFILDKISREGIHSLTDKERALLDAQKDGDEASDNALSELTKKEDKEFEIKSDDGEFSFEYKKTLSDDVDGVTEFKYFGIMHLQPIELESGEIIDGDIPGFISMNDDGLVTTNFDREGYTDMDFIEGLEYEYEKFIEEVLSYIEANT